MNGSLDDMITNVELIDNNNIKVLEIERILKIIESSKIEVYQLYYLKGYLWNLFPFESEKRDNEILTNLKKSIDIKDDYIYSKTELSYFYYDKKQYNEVIKLLQGLDLTYFEGVGQLWKSLKLQELLLNSKLYETKNVDTKLSKKFQSIIMLYKSLPDEKIAIPSELVNTVIENFDKGGMKDIIINTCLLIKSDNMKDYFDEEIKLIETLLHLNQF